ncbi:MAG: AbiV family abortive infection protein [Bacteroidia bacterium]|jgi:AbiV family abortive infection protein
MKKSIGTRKNFTTLTQEECGSVYRIILDNSIQRWKSAEHLAKKGDFGGAMSFVIVSTEELIKAFVIFLDSKGFRFRQVNGIWRLFKDHEIRLFIAYAMYNVPIYFEVIQDAIKELQKLKIEIVLPDIEAGTDLKINIGGLPVNKDRIADYFRNKRDVIRQEGDWFSEMESLRQKGFYCDYDEELLSPIHVDKKAYTEVRDKLARVNEVAMVLMNEINSQNPEVREVTEKLMSDFEEKDSYKRIENDLKEIKNKDIFKVIDEKLKQWNI